MIVNSLDETFLKNFKPDLVIVGCGLGGTFLASLLKDIKKKILIVEKGSETKDFYSENRTVSTGLTHLGSQRKDNFLLGGNGNYWGGQLVELSSRDISNKYWGLDYRELVKLYNKIYDIFKIKIINGQNIDSLINNKKKINFSNVEGYFTSFLKEQNIFNLYKKDLENSKNIAIVYNLSALDLKFDDSNKAKTLICYSVVRDKIYQIDSKIFIFNMGTIENNRFFLTLKNKKENSPIKSIDLIGYYFHDHIGIEVGKLNLGSESIFRYLFENRFFGNCLVQPKLRTKNPSPNDLNISAEFLSKSQFNKEIIDGKALINSLFRKKNIKLDIKFNLKFFQKISEQIFYFFIRKRIKSFHDLGIFLYLQSEQFLVKDSRILINKSNLLSDRLPQVFIDWRIRGDEFKFIREFINKIKLFCNANNIGDIEIYDYVFNDFEIYKKIIDTNHSSGGLIISKIPDEGVCDKDCLVWGTQNVYLNGSSTFPNSGYANIALTILAFTYKLSEHIKKHYLNEPNR
jgi:hypothetical protein